MQAHFEDLAQSLVNAWNAGTTIALSTVEHAPQSRADAYAIQDRFAEIFGDRCIGWKVGAVVPAVQRMEGHDGPITGRLFASRQFTSPAQVPAALVDGYKVECEFAFKFKNRVPARKQAYTRAELLPELIFHPGLEIAGHRFSTAVGERKATTHDLIADNGASGAYIEAQGFVHWQQIDFANMPIDARIDGGEAIRQFSGDLYRDPVDILVETVNGLSERGIDLAVGDLLTTGSVTLPTPMHAGQTFVAQFGDLATLRLSLI
ncbi:2-hydroxyhexa-2,4-dienoate hydratase [mine drainage metagenome]|uniref:2-hydroxyhexa-2,4-dienoate hydratase n=1 Tax=mine drainage metagenome TaxID=410659 RepID=A0A1J5PGZ0_9ZZZZ